MKRVARYSLEFCGWSRQTPRVAAALWCAALLATTAHAQDFQWWTEVDLAREWRSVALLVPSVVRLDSRLPNPQLAATGVEIDVQLSRYITAGGGYLFADLPQGAQSHVHLPLIAVSTTLHVGRLTIADRNRVEKLIGYGVSPVRYRNRFTVELPIGPTARWHVFGDDEAFFDTSVSGWTQNRLRVGGGARVVSGLSVEVFYLQRRVAGGVPSTNVFGTTAKIALKPSSRRRPS